MSKTATLGMTITQTSSWSGEQSQIDLQFSNSSSPGTMYTGVTPAGTNKLPLHNTNVMPFYYALVPVPTTAGTITLLGAGTDVGVLISSTNPSFIPVAPNTSSSGHVPTTQMINVALSQNTAIMVAVV